MNNQSMDIKVKRIGSEDRELVEIYCHEISDQVKEIVTFVKSRQGKLSGNLDGEQFEIPITDVCYIEAVDNKVFLYCTKQVYETRQKLYELEEVLIQKHYARISKSILVNLMKVKSLKPALNGRFTAVLQNGEEVIISRKYVHDLQKILKGGEPK